MGNVFRTMRGKNIDLDKAMLQNEKVVAVGNMRVNARGDLLGPGGKIVKRHDERVREASNLHTMVPDDIPVATSSDAVAKEKAKAAAAAAAAEKARLEAEAAQKALEEAEKKAAAQPKSQRPPRGGMASALASETKVEHKAQEPKPTRKKRGVKRI